MEASFSSSIYTTAFPLFVCLKADDELRMFPLTTEEFVVNYNAMRVKRLFTSSSILFNIPEASNNDGFFTIESGFFHTIKICCIVSSSSTCKRANERKMIDFLNASQKMK
ncbi:Tetraacyldisaccharide 4'-kinase [Trichinella spiralis]|uniref:Tetraacyldisaccharide 4'-kinase n=1 Tax=Trichinella spiralis TaxID=6334 RepID=A0ABR3K5H9_TRISP